MSSVKSLSSDLIILMLIALSMFTVRIYIQTPDLVYCQEYISGTGNIKGDVDIEYFSDLNDKFSIGANSEGYAVFKDPKAAFNELHKQYPLGIKLIQEEFNLSPLTQSNYEQYGTYGWQVSSGTDVEKAQAAFVSGFMDIYENSFDKF